MKVRCIVSEEWYYTTGGVQAGPVSWDMLRQMAGEKKIAGGDLVWNEEMPEWVEARTLAGLLPTKGPPPLPKGSTEATKTTVASTGSALSSQVRGGEASYTVLLEPYTGRVTSPDPDKVDVAIDGRKLGSGSLRNGFRLPCGIRAIVGVHNITISPSAGVGAKLLGMYGKRRESTLPEESYRIEFPEPGDYTVEFRFEESRTELEYAGRRHPDHLQHLRRQGVYDAETWVTATHPFCQISRGPLIDSRSAGLYRPRTPFHALHLMHFNREL